MRKLKLQELNRVNIQTFKEQAKTPIIIVLDNIRSAHNVGSAFRTADAFALAGIYLCGITAQPPHREILKSAIGATQSVDWTYFKTTLEAVETLKQEGYQIVTIEQAEGSFPLQNYTKPAEQPIALVFGNEVNGVHQDVMNIADVCLEIEQFGTKHSLNISVCLGIVVWEVVKQFRY